MKVLGIDPGTHRIGWGLVEGTPQKQIHLASGSLEIPPRTSRSHYLQKIYQEIKKLCEEHKPDIVCVEKLYFQTNVKTAITVAEARGVILLAIAECGLEIIEYSPNTIKSHVTGYGSSSKAEVMRMVGLLIGNQNPKLDDTSDALAVAISGIVTGGKSK